MIPNPNPVSAAPFAGMWVTSCILVFPTPGRLLYAMKPYNGSDLLAAGGIERSIELAARISVQDQTLDATLAGLELELHRVSEKDTPLLALEVIAPYPDKPVVAIARFADGSSFTIDDCFARAGEDPTFAAVFMGVMGELARQAGL